MKNGGLARKVRSAAVLAALAGTSSWWAAPQVAGIVVVAVGDMACSPAATAAAEARNRPKVCRQMAVSDAVLATRPEVLLALGDEQYEEAAPQDWAPYDLSYGRLRSVTHPVPGNHEYLTEGASGYYGYFGARAGPRARGYYSFDLGGWHLIALNSECGDVGGCGDKSPELVWLRDDLQRHRTRCTLAYWHIPRFSSGQHGDHAAYRFIWRALVERGADVVLAGHDHSYERLARLDAEGRRDDRVGIRSFVVGTGGRNLTSVTGRREGSERVIDDAFGFLQLHLYPDRYAWQFRDIDGAVLDHGEDQCN